MTLIRHRSINLVACRGWLPRLFNWRGRVTFSETVLHIYIYVCYKYIVDHHIAFNATDYVAPGLRDRCDRLNWRTKRGNVTERFLLACAGFIRPVWFYANLIGTRGIWCSLMVKYIARSATTVWYGQDRSARHRAVVGTSTNGCVRLWWRFVVQFDQTGNWWPSFGEYLIWLGLTYADSFIQIVNAVASVWHMVVINYVKLLVGN